MYVLRYLGIIAVAAVLAGCAAQGPAPRIAPTQPVVEDEPTIDEIYAKRFALEDFWNRVEAAKSFNDTGNRYLFTATRDSLVSDINGYIRTHPDAGTDPDFSDLFEQLQILESMEANAPADHFESAEDSLALLYAEWPELDIELDDGRIFSEFDTAFPRLTNNRIDFWIRYFTGPGKARFERTIYRMQLYRPIVEEILDELGLPRELICVALIESGFVMEARSYAHAVGPWQFIRGTGKLYGLRTNWWYDERQDIVASTYAAGNYLRDLYGIWEDWALALAAYNCGEYRVIRQTARQGTKNFWRLQLPRQTQRYVPKFLASLYILREPEKYGIKVPLVIPHEFDYVTVKDATDLKVIARCAETSESVIKDLNPACLRWATPPKMEVHIRVPRGKGTITQASLDRIPPDERITWRRHTIRQGETLSQIARKYGTTVTALRRLNNIRNSHRIRAGKALIVPMQGGYSEVASSQAGSKPAYKTPRRKIDKKALQKYAKSHEPPKGYKRLTYTVKQNDTLGEIAEVYKTSARKIRGWNNLSYRRYIYPGQKLAIYVPDSFDTPESARSSRPASSTHERHMHTVKKGETFYSISKLYEVQLNDLLSWNNKNYRAVIRPGDKLLVWKKKSQG